MMKNNHQTYTTELVNELMFSFSRSSGPGGQNVNKVNTKVELRFDVINSFVLIEEEKTLLFAKLANKINSEGILIIVSQATRSQLKNKSEAIAKFYKFINEALMPEKIRKPIKVSKQAKEKRLKNKKELSEKKIRRKF